MVSIVICTKNRSDSLRDALAILNDVIIPDDVEAEVVIIDNGSSDDTGSVAKSAKLSRMKVRYFFESRIGTGHARNRGVQESRGEIVVFIDDDVVPSPDWLERLCRPILANEADVVVGAVILPQHLYGRIPFAHTWFASTQGINADHPERFVTANVAINKRVFNVIPGFDPELGAGTELGSGEDTLLSFQIREAGLRMISRFDAIVDHHFDESRVTRKCLLDMAGRIARATAYVDYHWLHYDHHWSVFQNTKLIVGICLRRLLHFVDCFVLQKPLAWEVLRIYELQYRQRFITECRKPRKYEYKGLQKKDHINPACSIK